MNSSCDHEGNTPLHLAVIQRRGELASQLLKEGADPHLPNNLGFSSYQLAHYLKVKGFQSLTPPLPLPEPNIAYDPQIRFASYPLFHQVALLVKRALDRGSISDASITKGLRFKEQIRGLVIPHVRIRYINERIGYGVFAEEPFTHGQWVGLYTGKVRWRGPLRGLLWATPNDYTFRFPIGTAYPERLVVDALHEGNHTRYFNHSDEPNLESEVVYCDGMTHIVFTACRPIKGGDQLCFDYGEHYWRRHATYDPMP